MVPNRPPKVYEIEFNEDPLVTKCAVIRQENKTEEQVDDRRAKADDYFEVEYPEILRSHYLQPYAGRLIQARGWLNLDSASIGTTEAERVEPAKMDRSGELGRETFAA